MSEEHFDLAIVGAGAAGLMTAIWAGRTARAGAATEGGAPGGAAARIVALDGARRLGAKILVAGGGRCNVTHDVVDERAFAGSSRPAIRKVLRRFGVPETIAFFRDIGVDLAREETGKLFPVTDSARTVLDALLRAAADAGVELRHPWRVEHVERADPPAASRPAFRLSGPAGAITATRVVLASGGRSLPKSGSDGGGYEIARQLGHSITPRVFPALVALTLPPDHFLCALSGTSADVALAVRSGTGKMLASFHDAALCTHFGVSGPAVLDASRYLTAARDGDPAAHICVSWLPAESRASIDQRLRALGVTSPARWLRDRGVPQRLANALCSEARVDANAPAHRLTREQRLALVQVLAELALPVTGDRGFTHAEATAGGVPLAEIALDTMESRVSPRFYVVGEVCDVDGRIGGFNFQWAWASGHVAGRAIGRAICR